MKFDTSLDTYLTEPCEQSTRDAAGSVATLVQQQGWPKTLTGISARAALLPIPAADKVRRLRVLFDRVGSALPMTKGIRNIVHGDGEGSLQTYFTYMERVAPTRHVS